MREKIGRQLFGERYVLASLLILMIVNLTAVWRFPEGYHAANVLTMLELLSFLWLFGFVMRLFFPTAPFLYIFEATALSTAIGLQAALATASLAPLGQAYADPLLARLDSYLVPWVSWPEFVEMLARWPEFFRSLNYVYISLNYEGPFLLMLLAFRGNAAEIKTLVASGAISGLIALPVFTLLPAQGAYVYYGYTAQDLPSLLLALPFDFPAVLEGLRDGSTRFLSDEAISGLISFPSFHAAGATMLSLGWMGERYARYPMMLLNGAIAFSAIPIGSHYFCDILSGIVLGIVAYSLARYFIRHPRYSDQPVAGEAS